MADTTTTTAPDKQTQLQRLVAAGVIPLQPQAPGQSKLQPVGPQALQSANSAQPKLTPLTAPTIQPVGQPISPGGLQKVNLPGDPADRAPLNFQERQALPVVSPGAPAGSLASNEAQLGRLKDQDQNPWGSAGNHPGTLGHVGHWLGRIANAAGDIIDPRAMRLIPGTELNRQAQEAGLQKEADVQGKEQATEEATKAAGALGTRKADIEQEQADTAKKKEEQPTARTVQEKYGDAVEDAIKRGVDPSTDKTVMQYGDAITSLQKQSAPPSDVGKMAPEIEAQIGAKPTGTDYGGKTYPSVAEAQKAWGADAERVKNAEAAAAGQGRGAGFNASKPVQALDPNTNTIRWMTAQEAENMGAAPVGEGMKVMSKQAQFADIHSAADNMEKAINNLDRPLDATQIGKLTLAMRHTDDPTVFQNEIETFLGTQQLTPPQQDLVVWMSQLAERAMSLRSIAGMGQGSDSLRAAILNTLPSLRSGSTDMMKKQLEAFRNQVGLLEKSVPNLTGPKGGGGTEPGAGGGTPSFADWKKKAPGNG